jgi:NADPH2:quinone reductase
MTRALAQMRGIHVVSIVRHKREDIAWDADSPVLATNHFSGSLNERMGQLTQGKGIAAVVDCVGGPLFGDLVRSLNIGGRAVIYGGFSSEHFTMHNFDLLMRGATIESYIYRYFFTPPPIDDLEYLKQIIAAATAQGFPAQAGGWHALEDFADAIHASRERPELGKQYFRMGGGTAKTSV